MYIRDLKLILMADKLRIQCTDEECKKCCLLHFTKQIYD